MIHEGNNLPILRGIDSASIALVYLDPPFNPGPKRIAAHGARADGVKLSYNDRFAMSDELATVATALQESHPALYSLTETARLCHSPAMQAYLLTLVPPLIELHRVLKPTGSILLHCDTHACHYLKPALDALFRKTNYNNHITWKRHNANNTATRRFNKISDVVLFYSKTRRAKFSQVYSPYRDSHVDTYRYSDEHGPWDWAGLDFPGRKENQRDIVFQGYSAYAANRHWAFPLNGQRAKFIRATFIPDWPEGYPSILDKLAVLDKHGLMRLPSGTCNVSAFKQYHASFSGVAGQDILEHIRATGNQSNEGTKYPHQKPLKLLDWFIRATTDEGDLVLDPYCGSGSTCVAAVRLGRKYIGIDQNPEAVEIARRWLRDSEGA